MKVKLLCNAAAIVFAGTVAGSAYANQDPSVSDTPAGGTQILPKPSVEEDLVYLKDIVALQTIRLDEAEELIEKQNALIEAQAQQLQALNAAMTAMGQSPAMAAAGMGGSYRVQSGDTLSAIARRNNTTVAALAEANNLRAPYPLRVGDTLAVPGAAPVAQTRVAAAPSTPPQQAPAKTANNTAQQSSTAQSQAQSQSSTPQPTRVASNTTSGGQNNDPQNEALPQEVGVRPEDENERPYLAIFSDIGGILTPKGSLYLEPAIDHTVTSDNRFFFQGIEIVDAVLIGAIEATDSDRRALTESLGFRYGLTNRMEIDGRFSYVSRKDRVTGVAIDDTTATTRDIGGYGWGDAEIGLHYQLNNGVKFPYTVANVRVKAPTGEGPFEVDRNLNSGIETELAVGSGFWTVEPSLTFILASDPASLYANIGYQMNMPTSPNQVLVDTFPGMQAGTTLIRQTLQEFDPGDALRTSIGVGLSLNERLSLNFGYDQSYFFRSSTDFEFITSEPVLLPDDGDPDTPRVQDRDPMTNALIFEDPVTTLRRTQTSTATVGSFLFGGSYAVNDSLRINLNGAIGATDEAPDARISIRAQYRLFD
ncbi:LysM peptidoglycan-binding domain-containing protein [Hyphococcus flavus]|uniref:LysM peptidoglycan-binding domain-containing protein n=1 Tax=Hyphococcus flavus TaxID=1866326 RepID=A0AAE9ZJ94_9PROT|nr:LysM peptidoglycan-binding domain-containing protein [Hyphococcus flavus]WDI31500.1 LysM peptidoglycan-binding domain-containing protein [Hyphococcus flavus]